MKFQIPKETIEKYNLLKIANAKGFNTVDEWLENNKKAFEALKTIIKEDDLPVELNNFEGVEFISNFKGKVFVNGEEETRINAMQYTESVFQSLNSEFDSYFNRLIFHLKKGLSELHIDIPTPEEIEEYEGNVKEISQDFNDIKIMYPQTSQKPTVSKSIKPYEFRVIAKGDINKLEEKYPNFSFTKKEDGFIEVDGFVNSNSVVNSHKRLRKEFKNCIIVFSKSKKN